MAKEPRRKLKSKTGKEASGVRNQEAQLRLVNQVMRTIGPAADEADGEDAIEAALALMREIAPRDGVEGMLAAQMVAVHENAMECLRRAQVSEQTVVGRDMNLKHAAKLVQIYARQLEALAKHRGAGRQKITVEHVNVESGGQAIVGNVETSSNDRSARPAALSDQRSEDQGIPKIEDITPAKKRKSRTKRK